MTTELHFWLNYLFKGNKLVNTTNGLFNDKLMICPLWLMSITVKEQLNTGDWKSGGPTWAEWERSAGKPLLPRAIFSSIWHWQTRPPNFVSRTHTSIRIPSIRQTLTLGLSIRKTTRTSDKQLFIRTYSHDRSWRIFIGTCVAVLIPLHRCSMTPV